jgi:uncharacterized protein (TIGR00251 family)
MDFMAITIEINVIPKSGKQEIRLDKEGRLKCYLKSAPEHGKANKELLKFLSKMLSVPQTMIMIIIGATSHKKIIKINVDRSREEIFHALGINFQHSFTKD